VVVFQSLSKRSAMTCYRVGWVAGDERIVSVFKKVKTNLDSGTATFIQDAAIAALSDETHVAKSRAEYRRKRDILVKALKRAGLPDCTPEATIYVWQRVPQGMTSVEFASRLLAPDVAIVTTPGAWISDKTADGRNPGEGYVRFALVPSVQQTKEAARKLASLKL
jgi:LL-diaminopimelate aminotransferase